MKSVLAIIIFSLFFSPLSAFARTWSDTYYFEQDYLSEIDIYPYDNTDAGERLVVALIGDGVQTDHIDYWSNVITGWNFIDATAEIKTYGSYDTAVAGIIAATRDVKGTIGITPKAEIMSLVVCDTSTCYEEYITDAIYYAVDNGADVIALTLGTVEGVMDYTDAYDDAIKYAYNNDVLIVAGIKPEVDSEGVEVPMSPGCNDVDGFNMVIGVGSVDDYENNDSACVDVLAPSADIFAAKVAQCARQEDCFERISGLPLAIGQTAGVGAFARYLKSYRSVMEIIDAFVSTADNGLLNGTTVVMTSLRVSMDEIEFDTINTGDIIAISGEHFNPRIKFKLVNSQSVISLNENVVVFTPELLQITIPENVPSGVYSIQIFNYFEHTDVFEIINLSDFEEEMDIESIETVSPSSDVEEIDLTQLAVTVFGETVERLAGYILLQVENHGEAWYLDASTMNRYYLKNGAAAYEVMRLLGLGITNEDLELIPTVIDKDEVLTVSDVCTQYPLANQVRGRILLQVEEKGEAWYVHPDNCYRIYIKDGDSAYEIMRYLSLGISNADLENLSE